MDVTSDYVGWERQDKPVPVVRYVIFCAQLVVLTRSLFNLSRSQLHVGAECNQTDSLPQAYRSAFVRPLGR